MRKNTPRHILHAVLDCLPIILIPILMVYSQNHEISGSSISRVEEEYVDVDFNQLSKTFDEVDISNQTSNVVVAENYIEYDIDNQYGYNWSQVYNFQANHKYLFDFDFDRSSTSTSCIFGVSNRPYAAQLYVRTLGAGSVGHVEFIYNFTESYSTLFTFIGSNTASHFSFTNFMVFDLTQMFGIGNEPTIQQFNNIFDETYYPYVLSQHDTVLISTETVLYDDTDIMSQAVYQLYNAVDKYFNMGNVFNLNNVYQWFEVNVLGGTSNIAMYIVWQIVLYEFVMDLLFLLYGLFMWFIDFCKRLIEKPLDSIK